MESDHAKKKIFVCSNLLFWDVLLMCKYCSRYYIYENIDKKKTSIVLCGVEGLNEFCPNSRITCVMTITCGDSIPIIFWQAFVFNVVIS